MLALTHMFIMRNGLQLPFRAYNIANIMRICIGFIQNKFGSRENI